MHDVRTDQHQRASRQLHARNGIVLYDAAADRPGGRIQPHRFRDHHARVFEPGQVLDTWQSVRQDSVELGAEPGFNIRMLGEQIERPQETTHRDRIAGGDIGDCLVAYLLIGHRGAKQGGQEIVARPDRLRPPHAHLSLDAVFETGHGAPEAPVLRSNGDGLGNRAERVGRTRSQIFIDHIS